MSASPVPSAKPRPVAIVGTVVTFFTVIFGGLSTVAGLQDNPTVALVAGLGMLVVGAANQALAHWVEARVVPVQDVGTYLNTDRQPVEGPAAFEIERKQRH